MNQLLLLAQHVKLIPHQAQLSQVHVYAMVSINQLGLLQIMLRPDVQPNVVKLLLIMHALVQMEILELTAQLNVHGLILLKLLLMMLQLKQKQHVYVKHKV